MHGIVRGLWRTNLIDLLYRFMEVCSDHPSVYTTRLSGVPIFVASCCPTRSITEVLKYRVVGVSRASKAISVARRGEELDRKGAVVRHGIGVITYVRLNSFDEIYFELSSECINLTVFERGSRALPTDHKRYLAQIGKHMKASGGAARVPSQSPNPDLVLRSSCIEISNHVDLKTLAYELSLKGTSDGIRDVPDRIQLSNLCQEIVLPTW